MKYIKEIATVKRKSTFSVDSELTVRKKEDGAPMKIVDDSFSRFVLTIVDASGGIHFNVKPEEIPAIQRKTQIALNEFWSPKPVATTSGNAATSPACTVRFITGNLKGKTPAEVLAENGEKGKEMLNSQYKWLKSNLEKFPKNKELMDAIVDAASIDLSVPVEAPTTTPPLAIFETGTRPLTRKKREDGKCFCYEGKVVFDFARKYPVIVEIKNYYAPVVVKESGQLNVQLSQMDPASKVEKSFSMTAEEWAYVEHRITKTLDAFEGRYFPAAYKVAEAEAAAARSVVKMTETPSA